MRFRAPLKDNYPSPTSPGLSRSHKSPQPSTSRGASSFNPPSIPKPQRAGSIAVTRTAINQAPVQISSPVRRRATRKRIVNTPTVESPDESFHSLHAAEEENDNIRDISLDGDPERSRRESILTGLDQNYKDTSAIATIFEPENSEINKSLLEVREDIQILNNTDWMLPEIDELSSTVAKLNDKLAQIIGATDGLSKEMRASANQTYSKR